MSKTDLKSRRMKREDIDPVLALSKKVGGPQSLLCYWDLNSMNPGESTDMSFVVEDKNRVIGFLKARLEYMYVPVTEVCMIHTLVLDPVYRRRGIGSMLINSLIDACVLNEINTIRALIDEHDNDLKTFVSNLGFRRSNIINYDKTIDN
jgi:N-acetylglutamate synthase-like GNAT family acetyltransferase